MTSPDDYARERATLVRDDWQYARIFSAPEARAGFTALLGLRGEMQDIKATVSESAVAQARFEWWRQEISRAFANQAQHPLAKALGEHLGAAGSAPEYCHELIDAAEAEYEREPPRNAQELQLYLYRSAGVLAEQLAWLHGRHDRDTLSVAHHVGQSWRLVDLMLSLPAMLRANAWMFPWEWKQELALDVAQLPNDTAMAERLVAKLFETLDNERVHTRTAMENVELPPVLRLMWTLAERDYRRLRKLPAQRLLTQASRDNPLARLWAAWRAARKR